MIFKTWAGPIRALLCAALLAAALPAHAPAFAFDPKKATDPNQFKPGAHHRDERRPSQLYPRDERDRRALQQLMRHDRARRAVEQGEIRPLNEIRGRVRRQFNGRIVGMELHERPRGWIYDMRVLTKDGDVMAVEMDARTGQVVSVRGRR